jgi:hypothetical protein
VGTRQQHVHALQGVQHKNGEGHLPMQQLHQGNASELLWAISSLSTHQETCVSNSNELKKYYLLLYNKKNLQPAFPRV